MKSALQIFVVFAMLFSLSACSDNSSKSPGNAPLEDNDFDDSVFEAASCRFTGNEGEVADLNYLTRSDVKTAAFGKGYNNANLDGISATSIKETIRYIQGAGLSIYKVGARSRKSCANFAALPVPPQDISQRWNEISKDDGIKRPDGSRGWVLAFYQPKDANSASVTTRTQPIIVIRQDNDRYTLVHEFMHHLFYVNAEEKGHTDSKIRADIEEANTELGNSIQSLKLNKTAENLLRAEKAVLQFEKALDPFLLSFYLEEMTIEDTLRVAKETGKLRYVSEYGRNNGSRYIHSSAANAMGIYDYFEKKIAEVKRASLGMPLSGLIAEAEEALRKRKDEIYQIKARNPLRSNNGRYLVGHSAADSEEETVPCAHSKEADEILKNILRK